MFNLFSNSYKEGQRVTLNGVNGTVTSLGLLTAGVALDNGKFGILPLNASNSQVGGASGSGATSGKSDFKPGNIVTIDGLIVLVGPPEESIVYNGSAEIISKENGYWYKVKIENNKMASVRDIHITPPTIPLSSFVSPIPPVGGTTTTTSSPGSTPPSDPPTPLVPVLRPSGSTSGGPPTPPPVHSLCGIPLDLRPSRPSGCNLNLTDRPGLGDIIIPSLSRPSPDSVDFLKDLSFRPSRS